MVGELTTIGDEKWKPVPYPDFSHYLVSTKGRIYNTRIGEYINTALGTNGYLHYQLQNNGKYKRGDIHRLVAETFIPNPNNLPCVMHKDNNKTNPCVENLSWGTFKENSQQALKDGLTPDFIVNMRMHKNHPLVNSSDNRRYAIFYRDDCPMEFAYLGCDYAAEQAGLRSRNVIYNRIYHHPNRPCTYGKFKGFKVRLEEKETFRDHLRKEGIDVSQRVEPQATLLRKYGNVE